MKLGDNDQPFGMMTIAHFIMRASFTPIGIAAVFACAAGWCMWQITYLPVLFRLVPAFGYTIVFLFFAFVFTLVAALGDFLVFYVMSKVYGDDCTRTAWQKLLYFALSAIGFVVAAVFVSIGDHPITRAMDP